MEQTNTGKQPRHAAPAGSAAANHVANPEHVARHGRRPEAPETTEAKTSGCPTQPSNRSSTSLPRYMRIRRRKLILHRILGFFKRIKLRYLAALAAIAVVIVGASLITQAVKSKPRKAVVSYIFQDGNGNLVNMQRLMDLWATYTGESKRYDLTDSERWLAASVVTAEATGEPFAGKVAVAQCILQACEDDGIRPDAAVEKYDYSRYRPDPTDEALEAVAAVFDYGIVATKEPIKYFYAPGVVRSDWHEQQGYVLTINGHKFFKEAFMP